ncbi:Endophilin-A2 [Drechslerella dactyloides]|uniref:Endophilin-A2 n=1 Tax=Drechslerella dactyloides TaxID=74499 RepID=A0AAD6NML1_DREDA|nr:Endophilin-A2 [Drechslerella dactyloides]
MDTLQNFGKNVSNTFSTNFTPFAARTQQFVKEQLGQADDKVSEASVAVSSQFQRLSHIYAPKFLLSEFELLELGLESVSAPAPESGLELRTTAPHIPAFELPLGTGRGWCCEKIRLAEADMFLKWNGGVVEKTQLPADYRELESRVDALQKVHAKMLSVTSQYANEAYDYPPNLRESITDLSRNVTTRIQALSNAATPGEAQDAITAPAQAPHEPKTFSHAISRAALASSQLLPASDSLASGLEKVSTSSRQIGQARLAMDKVIVENLNNPWTTTLNITFRNVARERQAVENSRLLLDAAKAKLRQREQGGAGGGITIFKKDPAAEAAADEQLRHEIERLEDEFITTMEKAVESMTGLLNTPEPLKGLSAFVSAQLDYHQASVDSLQEVAESIGALQREQEAAYLASRGRA